MFPHLDAVISAAAGDASARAAEGGGFNSAADLPGVHVIDVVVIAAWIQA